MQIINIFNKKSIIYLFLRNDEGNLIIRQINDFVPYYYEPDDNGQYLSYNGMKLKRIEMKEPSEVAKFRSMESMEADILYPKRYIIDKIDKFDKCPIKYCILDIEVLKPEDEYPDPLTAKFPVTSITIYNSKYNKIHNWFIGDYLTLFNANENAMEKAEEKLFFEFITYMRKARFDLILGWYLRNFDYPYLFKRFSQLPQEAFFENPSMYNNFATAISPIKQVRGGSREFGDFYPAGTSIVDYLDWFKRIYKNEKSYSLDAIMEKYLGRKKKYNPDFSKISEEIKLRNIDDIEGMIELEQKHFKLIPLYDEMRRFAMITFEDFIYPMRIIDNLVLKEAKRKNVILPSSFTEKESENEIEGAYRETFATSDFYRVGKYDLSSCYPSIVRDLCLDTKNICVSLGKDILPINVTDRVSGNIIATYNLRQNPDTLLPTIMNYLLENKIKYKELKKNTNPESPEYENIDLTYEGVKVITNVGWGVVANQYFRLFDSRIASLITSTARDLLHYLKDKIEEENYRVLYVDTDGLIIDDIETDLSDKLNDLIQKWSQDRFKKSSTIKIEREGVFEKLFILTMCRYQGWLRTSKGLKKETKGLQIKRKDSTNFIAEFQEVLFNKIWEKKTQEQIIEFIKSEMERIKTLPIIDISFPAKLGKKINEYKTEVTTKLGKIYTKKPPIFVQAYLNTLKLNPKFKKPLGELFYWIYCNDKDGNLIPMAFDEKYQDHIKKENINWEKQIQRNILNICESVLEAKQWENPFVPVKVKRERKSAKQAELPLKTSVGTPLQGDNEVNRELIPLENDPLNLFKDNKYIQPIENKEDTIKIEGEITPYYSE